MKRWDLENVSLGWDPNYKMVEGELGDYVLFEDVAQLERDYEATRAINVRLQGEVDDLKQRFDVVERRRNQLLIQRQALVTEGARLADALRGIASYGEGPEVNTSFDEPHSARTAREVLAAPGSAQQAPQRPVCEGCGREIDPDCCGCGDPMEGHSMYSGHSPVPMGCACGYEPAAPEAEG